MRPRSRGPSRRSPCASSPSARERGLSDLIGDDHDLAVLREAAADRAATLEGDELARLRELIDHRRARLQKRALKAAKRLYEPKPRKIARLVASAPA